MGTAEPAKGVDLSEEMVATFESLEGGVGDKTGDVSTEDLSLVTKFGILAVIVALCYAFIRSRTPRRMTMAGRHGAYEKGGLP
jgi:hypothetical protein